MVKKLLKICLILLIVLWAGLQIANYVLVAKLRGLIQEWVPEKMGISIAEVGKAGGLFGVGVEIKGINIVLPDSENIQVKSISLTAPIRWPLKCRISVESSPILSADVVLSRAKWQVKQLNGHFFDFSFDAKGDINRLEQTGELSVRTRGLKTFIHQFTDVPLWVDLILKDEEQQFTLKPENGSLSFYGIPLFQL